MRRNQARTLSSLALLAMTFILLQSNYSNSFGQYRNQSQQQDTNTNNITATTAEDPVCEYSQASPQPLNQISAEYHVGNHVLA